MQQLEKKSRLDCDTKSNERIVRHMVKLAFDAKQWDLLNETVKALSKKASSHQDEYDLHGLNFLGKFFFSFELMDV